MFSNTPCVSTLVFKSNSFSLFLRRIVSFFIPFIRIASRRDRLHRCHRHYHHHHHHHHRHPERFPLRPLIAAAATAFAASCRSCLTASSSRYLPQALLFHALMMTHTERRTAAVSILSGKLSSGCCCCCCLNGHC